MRRRPGNARRARPQHSSTLLRLSAIDQKSFRMPLPSSSLFSFSSYLLLTAVCRNCCTLSHRTRPCQLSLSVISTGEGRVWMLSRRLCCATRRGWRRWRPSWKNKTISRQPPPQLQLVPLSPPRPRRLASPMMVFLRSSATDYNNYDFITTPTVNLTCDGEIDSFILQPLTKRQYSKSLMNITNKHKQANKFIDAK